MKRLLLSLIFISLGLAAAAQTDTTTVKSVTVCEDCPSYYESFAPALLDLGTVKANQAVAGAGIGTTGERPRKWYIGFSAGPQIFTGMTDRHMKFKEALAPVGGITIGGYLTKWLSLDANVTAAQFKGLYTRPVGDIHFATDEVYDLNNQRYYQKGTYLQLYARLGFDLNTIFGGYKAARKTAFVPYIGGGIVSGLGSNCADSENFAIAPTLDYGLEFHIRFCPLVTGIIDVHGNGVGLQMENEGCTEHNLHASYGAKLGLRFNLGK